MANLLLSEVCERLTLADELLSGRDSMFEPQDLPGRYGRVIKSIDRLLAALSCEGVLAGGWAVWRHGFMGRVTQDVDVVLPADRIEEFLRVAEVSGFDVLTIPAGRWPKLNHRETGIHVAILPEGARPGTTTRPAPTTISHPSQLGAEQGCLRYIRLPALIELKLAAGRSHDENDVLELIRSNAAEVDAIREHLQRIEPSYATRFEELVARSILDHEQ